MFNLDFMLYLLRIFMSTYSKNKSGLNGDFVTDTNALQIS